VQFLVDANLPPALVRWISERGHGARHVQPKGGVARTDASIWVEAFESGSVILSKDDDFARRRSVSAAGPQIVWIRLGNTRKGALLSHLDSIWPDLLAALERGEQLIEIA
jgi:predicted nuclease of predicted toxin-antitoxin system